MRLLMEDFGVRQLATALHRGDSPQGAASCALRRSDVLAAPEGANLNSRGLSIAKPTVTEHF
jgi:hypothetical protein